MGGGFVGLLSTASDFCGTEAFVMSSVSFSSEVEGVSVFVSVAALFSLVAFSLADESASFLFSSVGGSVDTLASTEVSDSL